MALRAPLILLGLLVGLSPAPAPAQESPSVAALQGRITGKIVGHDQAGTPVMLLQIRLGDDG